MFKLRSCASSMMSVSYALSRGSVCVSANKMPSVINLTEASRLSRSWNRTL